MKKIILGISVIGALIFNGCGDETANLDYYKYNMYSSYNPGNKKFSERGNVEVEEESFNTNITCKELATKALLKLKQKAKKEYNANSVIGVKWYSYPENKYKTEIYCNRALVRSWVKVKGLAVNIEK